VACVKRKVARVKGCRIIQLTWLLFLMVGASTVSFGQGGSTPLESLKEQEQRHKGDRGQVYLGKVLDLDSGDRLNERDQGLLLELTDVLKSPLRDNYRVVLKGCGPDGPDNPADGLRKVLVEKYGLEDSRISLERGCQGPAGRVEVHVHGDVSRAVRFMGDGGGR
jgi:hypothetical protein